MLSTTSSATLPLLSTSTAWIMAWRWGRLLARLPPASLPGGATKASTPWASLRLWAPASMACWVSAKLLKPISPSAGCSSRSASVRVASWRSVLVRVSRVVVWSMMSSTEFSSLADFSGVPISTTMTRSTPMARATSMGTFLLSTPSTSSRPSTSTGAKKPGRARLARIASGRCPWSNTTASPVAMSVATARKGMGRRSKSSISLVCTSRLSSTTPMF